MTKKKVSSNNILNSFGKVFNRENGPIIALAVFVIFSVIAVVVSHAAMGVPIVSACIFLILESILVACLNRIPIWIHGLVFIAQIVAGVIASQVGFMVLMAFVYVFALLFLFVWAHHE